MTGYAFYFDSNGCSGCKACQVACKDRNGLEAGRLWRRVYEVSGGEWRKEGSAWQPDVFAYYLSIACNHCAQPVCAEACPTGALRQRPDGIVWLDAQRCIGCQYCGWACPYGAPQYDPAQRVMSKCNFCADDLDAGLPPACVAACPLRVLDYGERQEAEAELAQVVTPLPAPALTKPALYIELHRDVPRAQGRTSRASNLSETRQPMPGGELPLIIFTLLAQTAVGIFLSTGAAMLWLEYGARLSGAARFLLPSVWLAGGVFGAALIASFYHLGRPWRAWRALANLRKSWLSREILCAGWFGLGWAGFTATQVFNLAGATQAITFSFGALGGLALVYCMGRIYRLGAFPRWDRWQTVVGFLLTTLSLGGLAGNLAQSLSLQRFLVNPLAEGMLYRRLAESGAVGWTQWVIACALLAEIFLWLAEGLHFNGEESFQRRAALRSGAVLAGLALVCILIVLAPRTVYLPRQWIDGLYEAGLIFASAAHILERRSFYLILGERGL